MQAVCDSFSTTGSHWREPLGVAHAILQAEPNVDGDFVLMLGDNVFRGNLPDITNRQREDRSDAAFLVGEGPTSSEYTSFAFTDHFFKFIK